MKDFAGSLLMVLLTMVIGIGCYGAATHGASQRAAIDDMRRQLIAEAREIRDLEAELRTRARLPQLERWNDQVLKMSAPAAGQFMATPVQLINLVTPPEPVAPALEAPTLRLAVAPAAPTEQGGIVRTGFEPDAASPDMGPPETTTKPSVVRTAFEASPAAMDQP
ncbi:MAG: hypothetical protein ACMVO5_13410 [Polymorphobacter sp.]|uniref:hypothetical protein n=1 Tax=Polymorphobacter sp. TaxID=1909290 RepID=UPI003A84596A